MRDVVPSLNPPVIRKVATSATRGPDSAAAKALRAMGIPDKREQQRRDKRFEFEMPVILKCGSATQRVVTQDVSYRGMFVRVETRPPMRQLVKIEAALPGDVQFVSHGMCVFDIENNNSLGRAPGVGIQFYAMGDERKIWEQFIDHVKRYAEEVPDSRAARVAALNQAQREHQRFPMVLEVRPQSLDDIFLMFTRDVSLDGMFLETDRSFELGASMQVRLKHPESSAVFPLTAKVVRKAPPQGVGVEFLDMTEHRRREFYDFIISAGGVDIDPSELLGR